MVKKIIKKATKKILPYLFTGLLINQTFPPIGNFIAFNFHANIIKEIKTGESVLNRFRELPQNYGILDYLNMASSIVYNFSEGKGDCKDFTKSTYDICIALLEQNNREDLKKNLRMIVGFDNLQEPGHQGIEYKNNEDEKYTFFETRNYTPVLKPSEVKDYSIITQNRKSNGIEKIMAKSISGKRIFYPTLDSLLIPGGYVRIVYCFGKNFKELDSNDTEVGNH